MIKSFSEEMEYSYKLYFRTRLPLKIILLSFLSSKTTHLTHWFTKSLYEMLKVTANQNKTICVRFAIVPHLLESLYHSKLWKKQDFNNFTLLQNPYYIRYSYLFAAYRLSLLKV